jgi:hypothetical protein
MVYLEQLDSQYIRREPQNRQELPQYERRRYLYCHLLGDPLRSDRVQGIEQVEYLVSEIQ